MGIKLLWIGLTLIIALNLALSLVGISSNDVLPKLGAIVMVVGAVLFAFDK